MPRRESPRGIDVGSSSSLSAKAMFRPRETTR